jgi:hypothetical protein
METLWNRILIDFPTVDIEIIRRFVKTRTFIRIKFLSDVIEQTKHKRRNRRKRKQYGRAQEVALSKSESEDSE